MPIYEYRCPHGHETELVRPIATDVVFCPECGEMAARRPSVAALVVGPTLHPNLGMDPRWQEGRERADVGFKHFGVKGH